MRDEDVHLVNGLGVARVRLPGRDVRANGDIALETLIGLGDATVGVDVWRDGREHATIWRIPTG